MPTDIGQRFGDGPERGPDETTTRTPSASYLIDGQQRYRVDARLGEGGFGSVLKCWHEQTETFVAIKRVPLGQHDVSTVQREVKLLGRVESDHVNRPRASFYDPDLSLFYIVSDIASEGDLWGYVRARPNPLALREAVELSLGIARGLAAIHRAAIVHLDVKPTNVLIDRRDGRVIPRLGDFGLARVEPNVSVAGFSPGYAAPEQIRFEGAGRESDLFSFGLIFYELLTGQRAFPGGGNSVYAAWLERLQREPLGVPSARRPELASWSTLDVLCEQLTAYDRTGRRRVSAESVVATLQRALELMDREAITLVARKAQAPAHPDADPRTLTIGDGPVAPGRIAWRMKPTELSMTAALIAASVVTFVAVYLWFSTGRREEAAQIASIVATSSFAPTTSIPAPGSIAATTSIKSTWPTVQENARSRPTEPRGEQPSVTTQPLDPTTQNDPRDASPMGLGRGIPEGGTAPPIPARPNLPLTKVTASDLRVLLDRSSGKPTAVLLWRVDETRCPDCDAMLRLASRSAEDLVVVPLAVDQFLKGFGLPSRGLSPGTPLLVTPQQLAKAGSGADVDMELDQRVASRYDRTGVTRPLLAIPSAGGRINELGLRDYLSVLGANPDFADAVSSPRPNPATPSFIIFDENGRALGARRAAVFSFTLAGERDAIAIDAATQSKAAAFVASRAIDRLTRLWARLAEMAGGLTPRASALQPRDPSRYTDTNPAPGSWTGFLTANESLRIPVKISGRRKGNIVAIDVIAESAPRPGWATGVLRNAEGCPYAYVVTVPSGVNIDVCELDFPDEGRLRFYPRGLIRNANLTAMYQVTCTWEPTYASIDCGRGERFDVQATAAGIVLTNAGRPNIRYTFRRAQ
jgi:serine/threonine protein kinase